MAGFANWVVSVQIVVNSSQFSRAMAAASAQSAALGRQVQGVGTQVAGVTKQTNALGGMARALDRTFIGLGLGAGVAFAAGVRGAESLQDAIAAIAIATGQTSDFVDKSFTETATNMSLKTAQSVAQSMGLLRVMALSGINDPAQLKALAEPIAIYADTQYLLKQTPFDQSAGLAAKVAHEFGARTGAELTPILNTLFKASNDMPDTMNAFANQLKYYASTWIRAGVSPTEVVLTSATADRLGYGQGKSGTGFLQIYRNLLNPTTKQAAAQAKLGINHFIGPNGQFDVEGLWNKLNVEGDAARKAGHGKAFDEMLNAAFSSNAGLIAGAMSSDSGRAQYKSAEQTLMRVKDMNVAQAQAMHTLSKQTILLQSNFATLATMIAKPWMEQFTNGMGKLAGWVGGMASYMEQHQDTAKLVGGAAMGAAAYAGVRLAFILRGWVRIFEAIPGLGPGGLGRGVGAAIGGHAAGAGGTAARAGGAAAAGGRGLGIFGDLLGFAALRSGFAGLGRFMGGLAMRLPLVSRAVAWLTPILDAIGLKFFGMRRYLAVAGEWLAKLGMRFIPIVGEVLIVIDTLNFLRTHMKDIGHVIGEVAGWMVKNMPGIFAEVGKLGVQLMGGLLREILNVLNPMNWAKAISDMASGISEGFQDATALQLSEDQKKTLPFKSPATVLINQKPLPKTPVLPPVLNLPAPVWPEPHRQRTRDVVHLVRSSPIVIAHKPLAVPVITHHHWPESRRERVRDVAQHHDHGVHVHIANIDARGHADPKKAGDLIGAQIAFHMSKTGSHRNLPTGPGFGNAQPRAH